MLAATFSPSSDGSLTSARDNSRRGSEGWPDPNEVDEEEFWPPARDVLQRTSIHIISLHNLPKVIVPPTHRSHPCSSRERVRSDDAVHRLRQRGELRPHFRGSRSVCHQYHSELSGGIAPPGNKPSSCPMLTFSLHPVGGKTPFPALRPKCRSFCLALPCLAHPPAHPPAHTRSRTSAQTLQCHAKHIHLFTSANIAPPLLPVNIT